MENTNVGSKVKRFRESLGWSQRELAARCGITASAICQIEKGGRTPRFHVFEQLANAFNITLSNFTECESSEVMLQDESRRFYRQYGRIEDLDKAEQDYIKQLIDRFLREKYGSEP